MYNARDIDLRYGKYAEFPGNEEEIRNREDRQPPYSLKEVKELGIDAARAKYSQPAAPEQKRPKTIFPRYDVYPPERNPL